MSDASKIDDGGAAFPFEYDDNSAPSGISYRLSHSGMTLRDYFAAAALPAVIANCASDRLTNGESREQMFARKALEVADALIAASKSEVDHG